MNSVSSAGAVYPIEEAVERRAAARVPSRVSYAEADQATLLGLYHGYDQSRIALAKLVARYGSNAPSDEETERRIWGRARREGYCRGLFEPAPEPTSSEGLNRGAHSATLSAFATISQQAEELLATLRDRWPHLRDDAGGPLPAPCWEE